MASQFKTTAEAIEYEQKRADANEKERLDLLARMTMQVHAFVDELYRRKPRYDDGERAVLSFDMGFTGMGPDDEDLVTVFVTESFQLGRRWKSWRPGR